MYCVATSSHSGINCINIAKTKTKATTITPKAIPHIPPINLSTVPIMGNDETPKKIFLTILNINLNPIVVKIIITILINDLIDFCAIDSETGEKSIISSSSDVNLKSEEMYGEFSINEFF